MKNVRHLVKRCQGAALAGMIVVMTGLPTGTAWAIGPGDFRRHVRRAWRARRGGRRFRRHYQR